MFPPETPSMLPVTEPPIPVLRPRHGNLARWLAIGVLGAGLSASSALSAWRDEHAILINTTQSLPNWAFFIDKAVSDGFIKPVNRAAIIVDDDPARLLDTLSTIEIPDVPKWIKRDET